MSKTSGLKRHLVVCVKNDGFEVSLECRKIYVAIEDVAASARKLIRVIDESGEDYLYPHKLFLGLTLPPTVRRAVLTST